ncbi:centrosomal protein of 120 kDa-like isoform X1 [Trichogramma pretiosum]|uniref:centrosomal protein of 120 kDa-like isoform X1 n=1 Tax=Trichogramma pretiosum TaxID=7493 RepID=UPI0006C9A394|nr:centrosomal protein of 120 kDa-like isoform X1 [Trichogramma pretiosum]
MEDFTSSQLQLVLGVKEGCNFDRVQKPTVIIATLNGQCIETKKIQPDCNPQFCTDLIWETDKNGFRRMRSNQTPIKVECYAINENGSREKLGYILLSVRCAQIIQPNGESNIKTNWHNILGVKNDFNNCKPRLLMYLIIREKENKNAIIPKVDNFSNLHPLKSNIVPLWLPDEHLIQLGPLELCQDVFQLYIATHALTHLTSFFDEFPKSENNNFVIVLNILGTFIRLKPFKMESDNISINEKIVIKIRTSLPVLRDYLLTRPHFIVKLKHENVTIGISEVNLKSLIKVDDLQCFIEMESNYVPVEFNCIFKHVCSKGGKGDCQGGDEFTTMPCLSISVKLKYFQLKKVFNGKTFHPLSPSVRQSKSNVAQISNHNSCSNGSTSNEHSELNPNQKSNRNIDKIDHKMCSVPREKLYTLDNGNNTAEAQNIHRSYSLKITLKNITFLFSKNDVQIVEFRFYNSLGEIINNAVSHVDGISADKAINLKDINCKLHFICTPDQIFKLLDTFAPKINVCDATAIETKCLAQVEINFQQLLDNKKIECTELVHLVDCSTHEKIGNGSVHIQLEDHTMTALKKVNTGNFEDILNNSMAYKIIDELETWKERQKDIFKNELRKKEEAHFTLLNEEWRRRKEYLESKLTNSMQQCKILANDLTKTTEDLRARKIESLEKESKLIQANDELQWKYDRKLQQLQEALQKMQEEFTSKLMKLEHENRNLLSQIENLTVKNLELEKFKRRQTENVSTMEKSSLTEERTNSVLQQLKNLEEKLDNAQKNNDYFKEKWNQAKKEIHNIKIQNQLALESEIKSSRQELHNTTLDLEELLNADTAALKHDKMALINIQQEINNLNSESQLQILETKANKDHQHLFESAMMNPDFHLNLDGVNFSNSDSASTSTSSDQKLRMLIKQRDNLVNSGNYSSNNSIIVKLSSDIRSMLINS